MVLSCFYSLFEICLHICSSHLDFYAVIHVRKNLHSVKLAMLPHEDILCLQIRLFLSLVFKELIRKVPKTKIIENANSIDSNELSHLDLINLC